MIQSHAGIARQWGILEALALLPLLAFGATPSTSDYSAEKERVATDYQSARTKCSQLAGTARTLCFVEAKTVQRKAIANAEARYRGTDSARVQALVESAEADFDLAKAKCDARVTGNDRDVCIKEAKAAEVRTKAEAIANEKIASIRRDAQNDERAADYDVAIEECDVLTGASKDRCVADAKAKYRK